MSDAAPGGLRYHPEHAWARVDGDVATFGITRYAETQLGEVIGFDAPAPGTNATQGSPYASLESLKAVSDVIAPLSGEVIEINGALGDAPETINDDPYEAGWLVRVRLADPSEVDALLDAAAYERLLPGD